MNLKDAITEAVRHFASRGEFAPSLCDVRCILNDLVTRHYDQEKAFRKVRSALEIIKNYLS